MILFGNNPLNKVMSAHEGITVNLTDKVPTSCDFRLGGREVGTDQWINK